MIKWLSQDNGKFRSGKDAKYPVPTKGAVWIFSVNPTQKELDKISNDFLIPKKIMNGYLKERRSVIHSFDPFSFTFVDYHLDGEKILRNNVLFFVSKNAIVTILQSPIATYESVFSHFSDKKGNNLSPEKVLIEILDEDIEENYDVLESIDNQIVAIEKEISAKRHGGHIERVVELRRMLNKMSRAFWGSSRLAHLMRTEVCPLHLTAADVRRVDDLHQNLIHQLDIISNYKENLADAVTIYQTNISNWLATISNRINVSIRLLTWIMLLLTGLALIISVPNTIATIFGIPYFPLSADSYLSIVSLILVATLLPIIWFYYYWKGVRKKAEEAEKQGS